MWYKLIILPLILVLILLLAILAQAGDFIAVLQYLNPEGLTAIVFQTEVPNKRLCKLLNKNHWTGVKTGCPQCIKESIGCLTSMPDGYQPILYNKPIVFPYITSKKDRFVFLGMPMNELIKNCKAIAENFRTQGGRPAACIEPKQIK